MKKLLSLLLTTYYLLPTTVYAFNIGEQFAFGGIPSLGAGITGLVIPAFGLASTVVIFYFLIGAFKFLVSGGDKNALSDAQGMIVHALIGFLLLMLLFLILQ